MKSDEKYMTISPEHYAVMAKRNEEFKKYLNDPSVDAVKVFDPLNEKLQGQLELIREVSRDLQAKKDEDLRKAKQAAEDAEREAKEKKIAEEAEAKNDEEEKKEE